ILKGDLDVLIKKNLPLETKKANVSDFKSQQHSALVKSIFSNITLLEKHSTQLSKHPLDEIWFKGHPLDEIWFQINALKKTKDPEKMMKSVDAIAGVLAGLPIRSSVKLPKVHSAVKDELNADMEEMHRCFNAGCYRSAIILCGRILETALHRKYFEVTGNDLLEKAPGIGLGSLIAKLSDKKVELDPALGNQIHLINQVRIHSVHKKQKPFTPTKTQTRAILLYTTDILNKLF
ncbi:DUF4145 domain-containing protein, partial [Candidatus Woesearchaeota archaeon]|nr:DUF4145 domain-containing protein [Candidatus Woesearchaeota archaeon]